MRSPMIRSNPASAKRPLVSVVMPVFNAGANLRETLQSVLAQTYRNLEIIVVDDASSDATPMILSAISIMDTRVRTIRHDTNLGPAVARNSGLGHATGVYCSFIDSDDLWEPQKLALQIASLLAHPGAVICCCNARWERNGVPEGTVYDGCNVVGGRDAWKSILADCFIGTPCAVVLTKTAQELGGFDHNLVVGEDQDLWLRMSLAGEVIALPDILVRYRRRSDSYMERNKHLSVRVWMPRLEKHISSLASRLTRAELRHIRRTRYTSFARNLYLDGVYREAFRLFAAALRNGAQWRPLATFVISACPRFVPLKKWIQRHLGQKFSRCI